MTCQKAYFRFYEELNDFLSDAIKKTTFEYGFQGNPSVKDAIEAIGVPHTEVDLIVVDGKSVGFDYSLKNGDRMAVYPVFESLDISPLIHLRPKPLRITKFVLDVHLGKLTKMLRLLGFDSKYRNDFQDEEIVKISLSEKRIVLTMDRNLLKRRILTHGLWIRSRHVKDQVQEVLDRLDLYKQAKPFSRCLICNSPVHPIQKDKIRNRLLPRTSQTFEKFFICDTCDKIYWPGSHYDRMKEKIEQLIHSKDT